MFIMPFLFMFGFGPAFWVDGTHFGPIKAFRSEEYGILSATATGAGGLLAAISVPWLAERIGLLKLP